MVNELACVYTEDTQKHNYAALFCSQMTHSPLNWQQKEQSRKTYLLQFVLSHVYSGAQTHLL